ncbi:TcpE family conjugal transfer membrane protein [Staphylococcus simulans]|uniref:TcpE family conjugal transfer membrane protein n=1 Tax=Staphylococcus simulans TaxID=1286 RepID=UPI000D1F2DB8|nr:TcpE family conjugal transfer membrane protein [Staphylococcus simulans]PTJ91008.1 conjugal transfer protein [Staphylococcus simulans]
MDKKAYNLKRTFEQPIVMYEFTDKFRANRGFRLDFWLTFLIIWLLFLLLFLYLLKPIIMSINGLMFIYFTIAPYYLTKYIVKLKQDGKKLFFFLWDFLVYLVSIQLKNTKLNYDETIHYHTEKVKFK